MSDSAQLTPRQVAEAIADGVVSGQVPDLFAEDAVYVLRFAIPGAPQRVEGRTAILAYFNSGPTPRPLEVQSIDATYYEGADPEVVVMEFAIKGVTTATGKPFAFNSSIGVVRVCDGLITEWHDHPNTIAGAAASGSIPQLVSVLEKLE